MFIVSICAISTVSATDDLNNTLAADESITDDLEATLEETKYEVLQDDNQEKLTYQIYPSAKDYSIKLYNTEISGSKGGDVRVTINPASSGSSAYGYYFTLQLRDSANPGKVIYKSSNIWGLYETSYTESFNAYELKPGIYSMSAVNYDDGVVMAKFTLKVTDKVVLSADDYNADYNSGKIPVKVTNPNGNRLKNIKVKGVFTNGKKTVTKYAYSYSSGYAYLDQPGVGTFTLTVSPGVSTVTGNTVKKTAKIKKSRVNVKTVKVTQYKGFKIKLKAIVKSNGNNVNEGKVAFKINGKTYNVAVKNGVAVKQLKLSRSYAYIAKFLGNANIYASKAVKLYDVMKNRVATKIVFKNTKTYAGNFYKAHVKILTSSGKKVNGGWLMIKGQKNRLPVKNGVATIIVGAKL